MFVKLGPNSAKSDLGFTVSRISRHNIEYASGEKRLFIEVEAGDGLAVYPSSIESWLPPYENESLTDDEKAEILENVYKALEFLQIKYLVYW